MLMCRSWRHHRGWRRLHEHVHLHAPHAFFGHLEAHLHGVPEGDSGEAGQQVCVLGFVPVCRKLVWGADKEGVAFHAEGIGGLEPGAIRLLWEDLARALAQAIPGFGRRKGHDGGRGFWRLLWWVAGCVWAG